MTFRSQLERVLQAVSEGTPNLRYASVSTTDGRLLATLEPQSVDGQFAAMVAASNALGRRLSSARAGTFEALLVQSSNGYTGIYSIGVWAVLTLEIGRNSSLGLLQVTAKEATVELLELFRDEVRRRAPSAEGKEPQ
jgi:predicted regulator of Ras-like GTPase activity (Roadblock/LC7/MglB family)